MKQLLSVILLAVAYAFAPIATASDGITTDAAARAGFSKLSEAEKAEIIKQIATKAESKPSIAVAAAVQPEKVDEWLTIGERVGKMLSGVAKEVGLAVNDFVKTPVGLAVMAMVVWHFMGSALVHIVVGMVLLTCMIVTIWLVARRMVTTEYVYHPEKTNIFGNARLVSVKREELSSDAVGWITIATIVAIVITLLTVFTF